MHQSIAINRVYKKGGNKVATQRNRRARSTPNSKSASLELVWEGKERDLTDLILKAPRVPLTTREIIPPTCKRNFDREPNLLIHADNKLAMGALLKRFRGKLSLIYVDPPFDVGTDFQAKLAIGKNTYRSKDGSSVKIDAYRDRWGKQYQSYLQMLFERLLLARELLSDQGSLYLHCDHRRTAPLRLVLEEVFGSENYINECIWLYKTGGMPEKLGFGRKHDTIHFVAKDRKYTTWNPQKEKSYLGHRYGFSNIKIYEDENGPFTRVNMRDVWDVAALRGNQPERVDYPTQKPETLLERIVRASSNEGDLVADLFCGSGTLGAVAESLKRRWIMVDSSPLALHTTRKRMIERRSKLVEANASPRSIHVMSFPEKTPTEIKKRGQNSKKLETIDVNARLIYNGSEANKGFGVELVSYSVPSEVEGGLELVDFWGIDSDFNSGQPFRYDWCEYRTRQERVLGFKSPCNWLGSNRNETRIGVRVVDVFGNETTIHLTLRPKR